MTWLLCCSRGPTLAQYQKARDLLSSPTFQKFIKAIRHEHVASKQAKQTHASLLGNVAGFIIERVRVLNPLKAYSSEEVAIELGQVTVEALRGLDTKIEEMEKNRTWMQRIWESTSILTGVVTGLVAKLRFGWKFSIALGASAAAATMVVPWLIAYCCKKYCGKNILPREDQEINAHIDSFGLELDDQNEVLPSTQRGSVEAEAYANNGAVEIDGEPDAVAAKDKLHGVEIREPGIIIGNLRILIEIYTSTYQSHVQNVLALPQAAAAVKAR